MLISTIIKSEFKKETKNVSNGRFFYYNKNKINNVQNFV